jgi:phage baseplate assembly protein V
MIIYGIISEIGTGDNAGKCRVEFEALDGIVSDWLPVVVPFSGDNKRVYAVNVNECVVCLMDKTAEDGVIIGKYYDTDNSAPESGDEVDYIEYSDGTKIKYDIANSKLEVEFKGEVVIKASGVITLDNNEVKVTGDLKVDGSIEAIGNVKGMEVENGQGTALGTHIHPYVDTPVGSSTTSPATPGT